MNDVQGVLRSHPEVEKAWVFGSRAKGTAKRGSDVDLALEGSGLTFDTLREVSFLLNEETDLPFAFDLVDKATISSPELADHIERVGILVFSKDQTP